MVVCPFTLGPRGDRLPFAPLPRLVFFILLTIFGGLTTILCWWYNPAEDPLLVQTEVSLTTRSRRAPNSNGSERGVVVAPAA